MKWWEVRLCDYQPEGFMVQDDSPEVAVNKTLEWAAKEYPGMFDKTHGNLILADKRFPIIIEAVWS